MSRYGAARDRQRGQSKDYSSYKAWWSKQENPFPGGMGPQPRPYRKEKRLSDSCWKFSDSTVPGHRHQQHSPVFDGDREDYRKRGGHQDITELRKAEQGLRQNRIDSRSWQKRQTSC